MRIRLSPSVILLLVLLSALPMRVSAENSIDSLYNLVDSSKAAEITELQRLTGAGNIGKQVFTAMINQFRKAMPNVPEDFWLRMEAKIDPREIERMIVPIYDKYLTLDEILQLKAFYSTPVGQKVIATMPQIMKESMEAGQEWGKKVTTEVIKELELETVKSPSTAPDSTSGSIKDHP